MWLKPSLSKGTGSRKHIDYQIIQKKLLKVGTIIFSYGISTFSLESELVHYAIVVLAVPISSIALAIGYRNHKKASYAILGIVGLSVLILAVILGENLLSELGEQLVTLAGSILVAFSHFKNYRTCKELECSCHDN